MFDYLIQNVQILDGSGREAFPGSVALSGGKIAAVGPGTAGESAHIIDGKGRTLAPGFIDVHRHADAALYQVKENGRCGCRFYEEGMPIPGQGA